MDVSYHSGNS